MPQYAIEKKENGIWVKLGESRLRNDALAHAKRYEKAGYETKVHNLYTDQIIYMGYPPEEGDIKRIDSQENAEQLPLF